MGIWGLVPMRDREGWMDEWLRVCVMGMGVEFGC